MCDIKFRAWDNVCKKMVYADTDYDDLIDTWRDQGDFITPYTSDEWYPAVEIDGIFKYFDHIVNHEHFTVEQFTGLQDVNGKDIYVGDIVKHRGYYGTFVFGVVEFSHGCFHVGWHLRYGHYS